MLLSAPPAVALRELTPDDWPAVADIYWDGMRTGLATFETEVPSWAEWDAAHLPQHRIVAELDGEVIGWAALSPASTRRCYAGVVENSVYVAEGSRGQGIGKALLEQLLGSADRAGFWTVQASIFADNVASIEFHQRCGFRVVGTRERIGKHDGVWRDVVLMERRSKEVS